MSDRGSPCERSPLRCDDTTASVLLADGMVEPSRSCENINELWAKRTAKANLVVSLRQTRRPRPTMAAVAALLRLNNVDCVARWRQATPITSHQENRLPDVCLGNQAAPVTKCCTPTSIREPSLTQRMLCQVMFGGEPTLALFPPHRSRNSRWRHGSAITRPKFADTEVYIYICMMTRIL